MKRVGDVFAIRIYCWAGSNLLIRAVFCFPIQGCLVPRSSWSLRLPRPLKRGFLQRREGNLVMGAFCVGEGRLQQRHIQSLSIWFGYILRTKLSFYQPLVRAGVGESHLQPARYEPPRSTRSSRTGRWSRS